MQGSCLSQHTQHGCHSNLTLQVNVLWHGSSCTSVSLWTCMRWWWCPHCKRQLFSPDATLCTLHAILHFVCGQVVREGSLDRERFGTDMAHEGTFILVNMSLVSIQCAGVSKPMDFNTWALQSLKLTKSEKKPNLIQCQLISSLRLCWLPWYKCYTTFHMSFWSLHLDIQLQLKVHLVIDRWKLNSFCAHTPKNI
jgi:hypothetical protein